jgi:hypothetical protein
VRGILIREHLPDVAGGRRAQEGVGDGVGDRITIGVSVQMGVGGNPDATEDQRSAGGEPMGVVADPYSRGHGRGARAIRPAIMDVTPPRSPG